MDMAAIGILVTVGVTALDRPKAAMVVAVVSLCVKMPAVPGME